MDHVRVATIRVSDYSREPIPDGTGATIVITFDDPSKLPRELHLSKAEADRLVNGHLLRRSSLASAREKHPRAYERWTTEEEADLARRHRDGKSMDELAELHQRQTSAIRSRLGKLGLLPG
jgi:hypothetical protein